MQFRIAVQPDVKRVKPNLSTMFERWTAELERRGHVVDVVDVFAPGAIDRIRACDGFLWWFTPTPFPRDLAKRLAGALDHVTSLRLFPDWRSAWHFDDKIAQHYLFEAAAIPSPRTHVFFREEDALQFFERAEWPMVIKLPAGYRSKGVGLLRNASEARYWTRRLFGRGVRSFERKWFATGELQRGCVLVQEFVAGNDFDTRVVVIGDRAFGMRRYNRPGDFRASGAGRFDLDPAGVDLDAVKLAFHVARTLQMPSMSIDVLRRDGMNVVSEVNYFYEQWTLLRCPGYWTPQLEWHDGTVDAATAILDDFLAELSAVRQPAARIP
ncbi:MAG TPA: hypothetical protein VF911_15000 [Thermoanaerobaculia bacterium]